MNFPNIDPIAFHLGPLPIRWYGLAYVFGIIIGLWLARRIARKFSEFKLSSSEIDDFGFWAIIGVMVGGRLGSVLLYNPEHYFNHPIDIFKTWEGGMSFHGGFLGVVIASALFC